MEEGPVEKNGPGYWNCPFGGVCVGPATGCTIPWFNIVGTMLGAVASGPWLGGAWGLSPETDARFP